MENMILKTYNITKKYGKQLSNNNISITIKQGEIYGLIGQNGAGKTTFMRIIAGLIHQSNGDIELLGKSSKEDLDRARECIGSLIECPSFYGNMTARENLEVSRLIRNIAGKESIDEVLKLVLLDKVENKKVKNFSLGMKQRLGIANALLGNPKFLILDEPINGLDPIGIIEIRELLKRINKERDISIMISSHILSELSELATCYGIIDNGKLIKEISIKELSEICKQYIEIEVNDCAHAVTILETQMGINNYEVLENNEIRVFSHLEDIGQINSILCKNSITVKRINLKDENIESYFMSLVGGSKND